MGATRVCGQRTLTGRCQRPVSGAGGCGVSHNIKAAASAAGAATAPSGPPAAASAKPAVKPSRRMTEYEADMEDIHRAEYEAELAAEAAAEADATRAAERRAQHAAQMVNADIDETNTNTVWQDDRNQDREDRYAWSRFDDDW